MRMQYFALVVALCTRVKCAHFICRSSPLHARKFVSMTASDDGTIDEAINALDLQKAEAVAAQDFFKAGELLEEANRLRALRARPSTDDTLTVPADIKAISRLPEAAARASAKRLAEKAREMEIEAARAKEAAENDKRSTKQKIDDAALDVASGKTFANGFGGLFKAITGFDIRSDELKKKPPR